MPRPTVAHEGFFVPNAQDVARPGMAEPDRIDFNTLGNSRWGVIDGCLVTVSLTTAMVTAGTALVNGVLVNVVGGQSVSIVSSISQDRYDLVGVDTGGVLKVVRGTTAADPVFPDPPTDFTTLAAVFATAGGDNYGDNVVDKRNFLLDSLLTKISPTKDLILNRNGSGNHFRITGEGDTSWNDDTWMERISPATLEIRDHLKVTGTLDVAGGITADSFTALKRTTGSNLRNDTLANRSAGTNADLFQDRDSGRIYAWQNGRWEELATLKSAMPVGTVITSLVGPEVMVLDGWVPLDGSTVNENNVPALFTIPALAPYIQEGTPRTMRMPDARRRILLTDFSQAGQLGGQTSFTLLRDHLPPHKHNVRSQLAGALNLTARTGRAGQHRHAVTGGGEHGHTDVPDPGHAHNGAEDGRGGAFVCLAWGGNNKVDAFFNDRSHTYTVERADWTRRAYTGITYIGSAGSTHGHDMTDAGDHDHPVVIDAVAGHEHVTTEDSVGLGTPVPFTPAYLAVYTYVRS